MLNSSKLLGKQEPNFVIFASQSVETSTTVTLGKVKVYLVDHPECCWTIQQEKNISLWLYLNWFIIGEYTWCSTQIFIMRYCPYMTSTHHPCTDMRKYNHRESIQLTTIRSGGD